MTLARRQPHVTPPDQLTAMRVESEIPSKVQLTDRNYVKKFGEGTPVTSDGHAHHDGHAHDHDPTFYPSPRKAAAGPRANLAYVPACAKPADNAAARAAAATDPPPYGQASVMGFPSRPPTGGE